MRLIEFLIKRWINLEDMYKKELKQENTMYSHIEAYLLALNYLGIYDKDLEKKKMIFLKFINSEGKNRDYYFNMLIQYKGKEDEIIFEALKKCELERLESKNLGVGTLWRPFTVGCLFYEFEVQV